MTEIIVFGLWIIWTAVLWIFYHKIFKRYYFSLSRGLLQEIFIAALLGITMTGLTLYFWLPVAIILIVLGIVTTKKTYNNTPLIGCIILAVIMTMAGKQITKQMEKNKDEESLSIEDFKDFYDTYNDLTKDTYYQDDNEIEDNSFNYWNEDEIEDNSSDYWNDTENQPFNDEEILEYYDSEYILENSDSEYLTMNDLEGFSASDCRLARNELYARYGRKFDSKDLQKHFNSCSWYHGIIEADDFQESMLNDIEIANRDLIIKYEEKMGYR